MSHWLKTHIRLVVAVCALSIILSGGGLGATLVQDFTQGNRVCTQVNVIQTEIRSVLMRQRSGITQLAYYREHRAEAQAQLREIAREIAVFAPLPCN